MEKQELEQPRELNTRRKNKMTIEIHKAFGKKDLINNQWYKISIGCMSTEMMYTENFPFEGNGFIRLNTAYYQRITKETEIDTFGSNRIGFSEDGNILINPEEYELKYIFPKNPKYNSLLEQIMKTREVQFI